MIDMGWYIEYITKIRDKPSMYIGGDSTESLRSFSLGYMSARADLGLIELDDEDADVLEGFQYWIEMKLKTKLNQHWSGLIADNYKEYYETSMEAFYVLFDEYNEFLETTCFEQIKDNYNEFIENKRKNVGLIQK